MVLLLAENLGWEAPDSWMLLESHQYLKSNKIQTNALPCILTGYQKHKITLGRIWLGLPITSQSLELGPALVEYHACSLKWPKLFVERKLASLHLTPKYLLLCGLLPQGPSARLRGPDTIDGCSTITAMIPMLPGTHPTPERRSQVHWNERAKSWALWRHVANAVEFQ